MVSKFIANANLLDGRSWYNDQNYSLSVQKTLAYKITTISSASWSSNFLFYQQKKTQLVKQLTVIESALI